jgi:ADP-ribosylglycohydrolase
MIATILGDIIGIPYEKKPCKKVDFYPLLRHYARFTDDTVLTLAVASAILKKNENGIPYQQEILAFARRHPNAWYGGRFKIWMASENPKPYGGLGNGSAMRVSAIGWAFDSVDEVLAEAKHSAEVTHNHEEGIKGAQAVALAIFMARNGKSKAEIKSEISERFHYNLDRTVDEIRPNYGFDVTCPGSVPEAMIAFLESTGVENAIRLAVSLGGDADTQAAIAGGIAEAFYQHDEKSVRRLLIHVTNLVKKGILTADLMQTTIQFYEKYIPKSPVLPILKSSLP